MADKYVIRVTAGSDYDIDHHVVVPVNSHETVKISNDLIDADLNVRVQNYHGLPRNSPTTSPYFSLEPHASSKDQYSLAMRLTFKKPAPGRRSKTATGSGSRSSSKSSRSSKASLGEKTSGSKSKDSGVSQSDAPSPAEEGSGISGHDLQFGNDFDHAIRDRLPPGFSYAMNIVKWWIDPGLDGDAYADQPYLYGPALSSFNAVHVGSGEVSAEKGGLFFGEGGDEEGLKQRRAIGAPDNAKGRKKWALNNASKDKWVYEYDQTYCLDFFNPYLDFSDFALRLPGFTMPIMKYWDGQGLRYVLRNRSTNETYLVILFTLYLKEDVNEDGSLKPAALEATREDRQMTKDSGKLVESEDKGESGSKHDQDYEEARKHFEEMEISNKGKGGSKQQETNDDDVD
ncbi:Uu.00g026170.m01.CDS01 [Anthostomella pinea]|uniref:Uu.00g026170.m01.CDS01 n=1 Tax=Anthostomella pinea TaxID=933095 RepID=A0AAI8V7C3_9PEZI|nr:Uu.00g026170.m01.CDS01 [Anthostomella pinea]